VVGVLRKAAEKKAMDMRLATDKSVIDSGRRFKNVEDEINKLRDILKEKENKIKDAKDDKSKEFADHKDAVEKWLKEREKMVEMAEAKEKDLNGVIAKLTKQKKDLEDRYQRTIIKIAPIDMTVHSEPHGKILRIDRTGGEVYINLGSADNIKPQLTFSIFPADSTKAKGERKAAIEVVNTIGPHMAVARVVEVTNVSRDPIVVNDTLFNVAWSPSLKQHIAIAGLIDLAGDGSDNTEEFMRALEKQNMVIDSFMDLKDREYAIKGEMTFKTNYLVLGEVPNIDHQMAETDPRLEQAKKILTRLSEMQNEAGRLGVTIVPSRRFMSLIGFKTPRSIRPAGYALHSALEMGGKQGKAAAEGEPRPKAKEAMEGDEKMEKPKAKPKAAMEGDEKMAKPKAKAAMEGDEKMEKPKAKAKAKAEEDK
jgi:hypothetical protein